MKTWKIILAGLGAAFLVTGHAFAITTVQGKIVRTEGHEAPTCRTVTLKRNDNGQLMHFRIPTASSNGETGIMAITLAAIATGLTTEIAYDPGQTSGCGSEPRIAYITLVAAPF